MAASPQSIDDVAAGLRAVGYLPGESTALVSYLAAKLGKPILVEGPAGRRQDRARQGALDATSSARLVRLQCYEGLDEAKALYEWNYRKQLLRIQAEAEGAGWQEVQDDIFGEEFLLERPLMTAIASEEPVVLLIDEIDKTDQEFEAMLLELLSDFQISIPELGRVEARTQPIVLLTSNNTRELTEALKRRCLYLWLDYPELEHELEIVQLHTPDLDDAIARKLVEIIAMVRELDLKKPPSIAESIDWARALLLLGADDIDDEMFSETMSVIVKHRTDLDVVAERVGVKLPAVPRPPASRRAALYGATAPEDAPPGLAAHLLEFGEELRGEGVAVGTSELLDAFEVLREVPWTDAERLPRGARGDAREVPGGPAHLRARLRPLLLPRRRAGGRPRGRRRRAAASTPAGAELDLETLRQQIAAALRDGDEGRMRDLARLAIAAFGRQGEGSGVIGVDVQRIRRALGLRAEPQPDLPEDDPRRDGLPRDAIRRFEALLRHELERAQIERTESAAAGAPAERARPRAAVRAAAGPRRRAPRRRPAQAPPEDPGPGAAAAASATRTSTCAARCARRWRPAASRSSSSTSRSARGGRRSTCCATSRRPSRARASSSSRSCTRCTTRSARCARSSSSSASARSPTSSSASATSRPSARRSPRDAGVADISGYTDYGRVWTEFAALVEDDLHPRATVIVLGDARTNGRDPRADIFATVAARAGRTFWLNPEPRLYWNYGDSRDRRLRALLRGVRVLDDGPARGLRQGADAAGLGPLKRPHRRDERRAAARARLLRGPARRAVRGHVARRTGDVGHRCAASIPPRRAK